MILIDLLKYSTVLFAGFAMGCLFFMSLWWTIQGMTTSSRPAILFLISSILRLGLVLAGFFILAGGNWQRLIIGLLGFLIARLIIVNFYRQE